MGEELSNGGVVRGVRCGGRHGVDDGDIRIIGSI